MKSRKHYTYRWDPFEISDFISRERWLERCAARGLHLVNYTGKFPKFEKSAPRNTRYRLDYHHDGNMDDDQIELYETSGWHYVDTFGTKFFIFTASNSHTEELHTDPEMHAYAMRKLLRNHVINIILSTLMLIFLAILSLHTLMQHATPVIELLRTGFWSFLYVALICITLTAIELEQAIRFIRIWRQLHRRNALPQPKSYANAIRTDGVGWIIALLACFSWLIVDALEPAKKINTLSAYTEPLPFLQLADLEESADFSYDSFIYHDKDWANYLETSSTLFAPQMMQATQYGMHTSTVQGCDCYLYTDYFSLTHEVLAHYVLSEFMQEVKNDFSYQWLVLDIPNADEAYYCSDGTILNTGTDNASRDLVFRECGYQFLFLRVGTQALKICYTGEQNLQCFADDYVSLLCAQ